jgi:Leu/Phe-tRNA-protein transferase
MADIYYITEKDLENKQILHEFIYTNDSVNYYYSDDFSLSFYIKLAHAGFISVSHTQDNIQYLLPEMQFEYALLDFENLHISKKVKKLLYNSHLYSFSITKNIENVINCISDYHQDNWIEKDYLKLLEQLQEYQHSTIDFELFTCEVKCNETDKIVAGEIGYRINQTYTSLSGFTSKDKKYNNYGKLQITLLAQYLEKNNYSFWNMGHPYMQYKKDLGAKILSRKEFLKRWLLEVNVEIRP